MATAIKSELSYFGELRRAMNMLAGHPHSIFIGQGVGNAGTTLSATFEEIPAAKKIEFPVAEDLQMGTAIGLALSGLLPVCVFPRWNFLLCAANQLVNHLDRLPIYSQGGYRPKVIIRTAVPSIEPFYPGPQHDDDFTTAFETMFRTIKVKRLYHASDIVPEYRAALVSDTSTLLVEFVDEYKNERAKG